METKQDLLAQVKTVMHEENGWICSPGEQTKKALNKLQFLYGLNENDVIKILHPDEQLNEQIRLKLVHQMENFEKNYMTPLERYPKAIADLKSRDYYLAKIETDFDEIHGWLCAYFPHNDIQLQILKDFYGLDVRDVCEMLHPRSEKEEELKEQVRNFRQSMENADQESLDD